MQADCAGADSPGGLRRRTLRPVAAVLCVCAQWHTGWACRGVAWPGGAGASQLLLPLACRILAPLTIPPPPTHTHTRLSAQPPTANRNTHRSGSTTPACANCCGRTTATRAPPRCVWSGPVWSDPFGLARSLLSAFRFWGFQSPPICHSPPIHTLILMSMVVCFCTGACLPIHLPVSVCVFLHPVCMPAPVPLTLTLTLCPCAPSCPCPCPCPAPRATGRLLHPRLLVTGGRGPIRAGGAAGAAGGGVCVWACVGRGGEGGL